VLCLDFPQFFLGAEVDGAKSFTLAPQALKFLFDFRKIRQWIGWTDFGQLCNGSRFNFQHVADFPPDVASRRLAPSKRSSVRASSSRAALAASSAARASRSAVASANSAVCSRSAHSRREPSAVWTSALSARRFSAKTCGAFSNSVRSPLASAMRCSSVAI
jgi:hypothetical protein